VSKILFLDDDPIRTARLSQAEPKAVCVETAAECITQLKDNGPWDVVLLDHDLGGETYVSSSREDCGMEVVRWLELNKTEIGRIVVHSYNNYAVPHMMRALRRAGYSVVRIPFADLFR